MSHDIVELARNPVALLGGGVPRALLLLALEPSRVGTQLLSQRNA